MCEHDFKSLKIEKDGRKVRACQECGALKIGEDTIVVDADYIKLSPLASDPALAEGRLWFRSDEDEVRYSPDGAIVEILSTEFVYDLNSIRGFVYLAEGTATDSWNFTANPNQDVWIRQYSTDACFQCKYSFHGTYAHWTADNTFVDVPNKADNVYGAGEVLSVSQVPDGTIVDRWLMWDQNLNTTPGPEGMTWDGQYLWCPITGTGTNLIYKYKKDGTQVGTVRTPSGDPSGIAWDGAYIWYSDGAADTVYQIKKDGTEVTRFARGGNPQGLGWDTQYLWVSCPGIDAIYKHKPDGTEVASWATPWAYAENLGWDGQYMWHVNDTGGAGSAVPGHMYRLKEDFTIVDYFEVPGGTPEAACWDGKYLWYTDEHSNYAYKFTGSKSFDLNYNISPV